MTSVLAVETSGTLCSVCLDLDGNRIVDSRHVERRHNEMLLPMIDALLAEAGVRPGALDALAFACGPGSFTGVRIAAAAVQGIALAANVAVVPVSSSLALAEAARRRDPAATSIWTSIRSRADVYYLADYRVHGERLECAHEDRLYGRMNDVPFGASTPTDGLRPVGEQPPWWQPPIGAPGFLALNASAEEVAVLAIRALADGDAAVDAARALPLYVSGDTPWVPVRQRSR